MNQRVNEVKSFLGEVIKKSSEIKVENCQLVYEEKEMANR